MQQFNKYIMADLFSSVEPPEKRKRIFYKGKGGKFSDKETARITNIEKENKVLKANVQYWKRLAEHRCENTQPCKWTRIESRRITQLKGTLGTMGTIGTM